MQGRGIRKKEELKELLQEKSETLIRDMNDVENLQKNLGIVDPSGGRARRTMLQQRVGDRQQLDLRTYRRSCRIWKSKIDKLKLDIDLAQDPAAKEARAEEEMHKDEKTEEAGRAAERSRTGHRRAPGIRSKERRIRTVKRLGASCSGGGRQDRQRRDELMKKFSDSNEAVKVKEYKGKLNLRPRSIATA